MMERVLRQKTWKVIEEKRSNAKADKQEVLATVYESKLCGNKNLMVNGYCFSWNGSTTRPNAYYKCIVHGCNARVVIAQELLQTQGPHKATLRQEHNHEAKRRLQLWKYNKEDEEEGEVAQDQSEVGEGSAAFVDCGLVEGVSEMSIQSEAVSEMSAQSDPLSQMSVQSDPLNSSFSFLEEMLNLEILTTKEKKFFKDRSCDQFETNQEVYNTLRIKYDSPFGKGVVSDVKINKGDYIGDFYGRLTRKLPKNAIYSFKISQGDEKALFVDAEDKTSKTLLA